MELLRKKFLWVPLAFFFAILALDKVLLIPAVSEYTQLWRRIEPPFYESRYDLFDQLSAQYADRTRAGEQLGVIFGTSRAGEFNARDIASERPGVYAYNFSAPFASPSFHYYWLERMQEKQMRVKLAIIETDPLLFSPRSVRYSLSYSYDVSFVSRNVDLNRNKPRNPRDIAAVFRQPGRGFSFDEAETFYLKQLFAVYKFPPSLDALRENHEMHPLLGRTGNQFRDWMRANVAIANRINLGGIPNPLVHQADPVTIAQQAAEDANTYLRGYEPSPTQVFFFRRLIEDLAAQEAEVVIYWPLAPKPYRAIMEELGLRASLRGAIEEFLVGVRARHPGARIVIKDLNNDARMDCRYFLDSHHLSGKCYPQLTRLLLSAN